MSVDASEYDSEQLGQVERIIADIDIAYAVSEILPSINWYNDQSKASIAFALVEFYIEKIKKKRGFSLGDKEYNEDDKKLRIWEDVIQGCLKKLGLKKLDGLNGFSIDKNWQKIYHIDMLQRNLATHFPYIGTTWNN